MADPVRVEKNCKACGSNIFVRLADHKRGWGNFCDKACSAAYKSGMRPRDVNEGYAKKSLWAATCFEHQKDFPPTKAPSIKEQVGGKVRVTPTKRAHDGKTPMKHKECQVCGAPAINGVHSSFGEDNGVEWLCELHMDTRHPFDMGGG